MMMIPLSPSSGPEKEEEGLMDDYLRHPHSLLRGCTMPFGTWVVVHLVPSPFGGGGRRTPAAGALQTRIRRLSSFLTAGIAV